MKFLTAVFVFTALFALALAGVAPIPKDLGGCNYICHKTDAAVCATNGICLNHFSSLCELQIYNCLNPQYPFQQVKGYKCKESFQPLCTKGDFQ